MTVLTEQLEARDLTHRRWASAVTLIACASALWMPALSLKGQMIIVGLAVGLLGFPHGALDPLVAALRSADRSELNLGRFLGLYIGMALAVVLLWALSAPLGLALFLATSALHFGLGDAPRSRVSRSPWRQWARVVAHGAAPIILPAAAHPGNVAEVFGWLLDLPRASVEPWLISARPAALAVWAACVVTGYFGAGRSEASPRRGIQRGTQRGIHGGLLELGLLTATFVLLPPLLSFAVYFCAWHSVRHLITVDAVLGPGLRARGLVVGVGVLAATGALVSLGHLAASDPASIESLTRSLFVALAALTPPHMLVTAALARRVESLSE
ncbi:Beta-carotene 15,15'-dioxygenase [Planctomycetes bacterium Poly30]|uniref:Probable beta-carotene 15,15'-dioxygenase n=1 Tax=Saltatorellus ferox TaxID=2528018 RepID=A0A518EPB0_9BACT|nr:Beta-carotene 15,15'-dioxygenase [Planctomycetes bacterium Poly30]